jgi:hypothetical protein
MATTTNFGWETPDDTDLVKDGALAMRTLGNAIDTSLVDLKGGTTGQNLRKNSNTDMDFVWAGDATNTVIDAAGDLLYGTASDTLGRLAIGTAGQVLKVNSGATAPEWAAASSGALTFITRQTFSGVATADIDNIFSSTYETYQIVIEECFSTSDSQLNMQLRYSGPSTQTSGYYGVIRRFNGTYTSDGGTNISNGSNFIINDQIRTGTGQASSSTFWINQVGNGSRNPILYGVGQSSSYIVPTMCSGYMLTARAYTGLRLSAASGNLTANVSVYGLAKS